MQSLCTNCTRYKAEAEVKFGVCDDCYALGVQRIPPAAAERSADPAPDILLTTGYDVPNREINQIIKIVAAEAALGLNIFKDIANAFRDSFGGRSRTSQAALKEAREAALDEMKREAAAVGADAVIAVDLDYSEISTIGTGGGGILVVIASGTAVSLKPL